MINNKDLYAVCHNILIKTCSGMKTINTTFLHDDLILLDDHIHEFVSASFSCLSFIWPILWFSLYHSAIFLDDISFIAFINLFDCVTGIGDEVN